MKGILENEEFLFFTVGYKKPFCKVNIWESSEETERDSHGDTLSKRVPNREQEAWGGKKMLCLGNRKVCGLRGKNHEKRNTRDKVTAVVRGKLMEGPSLRTNCRPACAEKLRFPSNVELHSLYKCSTPSLLQAGELSNDSWFDAEGLILKTCIYTTMC